MDGNARAGAADAAATVGFASFHHRDFVLVLGGKLFGWISLHMAMVAIAYQIYDRTGNMMNLAYIGLSTFAPAIGFALITGYVADRFDRKLVIALCYGVVMVACMLFLIFTLTGMRAVWPVFVILVLLGTGRAFHQPAINAIVPNLVPQEIFPNAVAWQASANKIAQVAGPALGGMIYLAGPDVVYAVSVAGLAIGLVTTLMIRTRTNRGGRQPTSLATLLAGVRYVFEKKIVLGAITLDLFVVLLGGVTALFPVFAKDILGTGPTGAGFLRSAMAAGALVSGLALTRISLTRAVGRVLYVTVLIFGASTVAFGCSTLYWLSLLTMAVLGAADMVSVYIRVSLLQIATPDEMRGRVSAVNAVFTGASNEIGEFRAGTMAALIGAVPAVVVGGIGSILVVLACWRLFPDLTRVERLDRSL